MRNNGQFPTIHKLTSILRSLNGLAMLARTKCKKDMYDVRVNILINASGSMVPQTYLF